MDGPVTPSDVALIQRRTIGTLVVSQALSGIGMSAGIAVGVLLADDLSGSETLAGLATTTQVLGGALIAIPTARRMAARGRRVGLEFAYLLAFAGALLVIAAAVIENFPLMLAGMFTFGAGTAGNSQARYAAADLAADEHRGRDLSIVVWATTVGSVLGPNLIGLGGAFGRLVGIPELAGSFVFSMAGFAAAFAVLNRRLRPDPLLASRTLVDPPAPRHAIESHAAESHAVKSHAAESDEVESKGDVSDGNGSHGDGSFRRGLRVLAGNPSARYGTTVVALGHVVMVGVMVMTPIHMKHGDAGLGLIGIVISMHIAGMYAFSPLTGLVVDRFGGRRVALVGGGVLTVAVLAAAATAAGWSFLLLGALFLLGVGWSATFVAGSTLLTAAVGPDERPAVQGATDVIMGTAAAAGGALAGIVMGGFGYGVVGLGAAGFGVAVVVLSLGRGSRTAPRRSTEV